MYTKEEMIELCGNFGTAVNDGDNDLNKFAWSWAGDYDYDDSLDMEEAVHDAVLAGVRWAMENLKGKE